MSSEINEGLRLFFSEQSEVLEWGFTSLENPLPHAENLAAWVAQGMHAGLRYMEERLEERQSPRVLFPWAKTAVLFSLRQSKPFGTDTGDFRIAAYALGDDYHRVARRILDAAQKQLLGFSPQARFSGFVDTAPVFERDLAAEAGLGWRGKNTCLIHKKHGSGFLLSGFFTDLVLSGNPPPALDFCGGCTACLDQCPTQALTAPGKLDANKCISYWTIEAKGEIPTAVSERFGNWIFGCDICQEVCPWNFKHQQKSESLTGDWPRSMRDWLSRLRKGGGFQSTFKNSPLTRAGRRSLLRNVLIAMRHAPESDEQEILELLAQEEDHPVIRGELERTLGEKSTTG